jgi:NifU-like protein involved in Fe-S cluster formation
MTDLSEIYNTRIIELAATISPAGRLPHPDASASAHSKLCGSTVQVDLKMDGGRVCKFAQTVKACLLGQASAAVMAREIVGSAPGELREVAAQMRRMLKAGGEPPGGRWSDLAVLEPVREVKARHASTLLVFDAVEKALDAIEARGTTAAAG